MKIKITTTTLLQLLLIIALGLSVSGFVLEHVFNALPCRMCWWQRYAHWAIAALALFALITRRTCWPIFLALLTSLAGLAIAIWQTGGQYKWWKLPEFCQATTQSNAQSTLTDLSAAFQTLPPRCDEVNFTIMHLSLAEWNIPAMLLTAFISILILKKTNQK